MKPFFFLGLFSLFLVSHVTFAADAAPLGNQPAAVKHHVHVRVQSKADSVQPVNINQADLGQLTSLKGIGPKKAEAIIAYRTAHGAFKSVDDLAKVKGIGAKALARLQAKNPGRLLS